MYVHDLPNAWNLSFIGEHYEVFNGKTPSRGEYRDSGFRIIKVKDLMRNGTISQEETSFVDASYAKRNSDRALRDGDTLLLNSAHNKAYVGSKCAFAKGLAKEDQVFCVGELTIFRAKPGRADPRFIYYFLRSKAGYRFTQDCATGVHLYPKDVRKKQLPFPDVQTQSNLCDILQKAETLALRREQANQFTSKIIQSVFLKMFGDPAANPRRWPSRRLLELAELRGGIQLSKERRPKASPRPYLTIRNVYAGRLDLSDVRYIEVPDEQLKRWILKPGDLLVLEGGDRDDVGRTAIFRGELKNCVHQNHVFRVRVNTDLLVPEYLMHYLNSDYIKSQFFVLAKATTGINSINMTQLKSVEVLCPPIAIQKDFARLVERVDLLRSRQVQSATEITELFHSLMHKGFRGQLPSKIPVRV